jgi:hypothetical protein
MHPGNELQIYNLYWWNMFPFYNRKDDDPMSDPFRITSEDQSLYFRISPPIFAWITVFMMKMLIEINCMYTTEKEDEYKIRMKANRVI